MAKANRFSMIARSIWRSNRFTALESEKAKLLFFYYMTCEHNNGLGCFRLPHAYAVADLGWTLPVYQTAMAECIGVELIDYDDATQELFISRWLDVNPPQNQNHLKSLLAALRSVESEDFQSRLNQQLLEMSGNVQPAPSPRPPYR